MKRRLLFCLLAAVLALTGCTAGRPASGPSKPLSVSIGYWNIDRMNDVQSDAMRDYVENMLGISIQPVSVDWTNYKEYYQMLSTTDSLPDVFTTLTISSNDANDTAFYESLITSGRIQPLPDDLSAYPHLRSAMDQVNYTAWKDGHYYALPRISFLDNALSSTDAAMVVRRDWMNNLGLSDPRNLDEFIEMVSAFARRDPDGNGLDDTIGYNVNNLAALGKWVILGIAPSCNTYDWIEEDGRFIPSWYSADFERVVTAYHTMYQSGGLDPQFYAKNPHEVLMDFAAGRLGALEYKSSPAAIQEITKLWALYNTEPFEECVDVLPMFPAPDGVVWCNSSLPFWSESFISSRVAADKLERVLRLYDFLLSDEGLRMGKFGLEGVDYGRNADGSYRLLADVTGESLIDLLRSKYPSIELFSGLATWGGSDKDFELSEMNLARYGEYCMVLANRSVAQAASARPVERPEEFLIYPKEASGSFSTNSVFSHFIRVILSDGDPVSLWRQVMDDLREGGIEEYIQRQNDQYRSGRND